MQFSSIPGLQKAKEQLANSIRKGQVAHAQLFSGSPGGAALPMAIAYTSFLICEQKHQEKTACGECPSCVKMDKFIHPDVHFVFPVSGTKSVSGTEVVSKNFITEWRQFLHENIYGELEDWVAMFGGENKQAQIYRQESREIISALSLKPFEAQFKIMIIWLPELMNLFTANSLLKVLEEPSGETVFLFVSEQEGSLLSTILSRVQIVKIRPFNDEEIINKVIEEFGIQEQKAREIAVLCDGNLNLARKLVQNIENNQYEFFSQWMRLCFKNSYGSLVDQADEYSRKSKLEQKQFLKYALLILRESLVLEYQQDKLMRVTDEELKFVENFSKILEIEHINTLKDEIEKAYYHLERNANPKILFLDLSITVANTMKK